MFDIKLLVMLMIVFAHTLLSAAIKYLILFSRLGDNAQICLPPSSSPHCSTATICSVCFRCSIFEWKIYTSKKYSREIMRQLNVINSLTPPTLPLSIANMNPISMLLMIIFLLFRSQSLRTIIKNSNLCMTRVADGFH